MCLHFKVAPLRGTPQLILYFQICLSFTFLELIINYISMNIYMFAWLCRARSRKKKYVQIDERNVYEQQSQKNTIKQFSNKTLTLSDFSNALSAIKASSRFTSLVKIAKWESLLSIQKLLYFCKQLSVNTKYGICHFSQ